MRGRIIRSEAIRQLQRVSALSGKEADQLRDAYVFFRRLEHRLQMMHNRSDYSLPEGEDEQRVLARTMDMESAESYRKILDVHLKAVQEVYAQIFTEAHESEGRSIGALVNMEIRRCRSQRVVRRDWV